MSQILAFVMNPMEGVNINADTSFAFMLAGAAKGCRIFHVNPADLDLRGDRLFMRGRFIEVARQEGQFFKVLEEDSIDDCTRRPKECKHTPEEYHPGLAACN